MTEGVTPYVKRLNRKIREGCGSLYIIAFKLAVPFQKKVVKAIREDVRILIAKEVPRIPVKRLDPRLGDTITIVQLRIGQGFEDKEFEDHLKECRMSEGDVVPGKVIDVAESVALVNVQGLTGCITRPECAWSTVSSCADVFTTGGTYNFQITRFDRSRGMLVLTRRFPDDDPFVTLAIPAVGDLVDVRVVGADSVALICQRTDGLEIQIPFSEVSWMGDRPENPSEFFNRNVTVGIYEIDPAHRLTRGSLRRLEENPWQAIHDRFPKGTQIRGTVTEVNRLLHFVRVQIADGIVGILPAESMVAAGYEYSDFENTLLVGQTLDVVVTKVFINKRKIRLDLQRNIANMLQSKQPTP